MKTYLVSSSPLFLFLSFLSLFETKLQRRQQQQQKESEKVSRMTTTRKEREKE